MTNRVGGAMGIKAGTQRALAVCVCIDTQRMRARARDDRRKVQPSDTTRSRSGRGKVFFCAPGLAWVNQGCTVCGEVHPLFVAVASPSLLTDPHTHAHMIRR